MHEAKAKKKKKSSNRTNIFRQDISDRKDVIRSIIWKLKLDKFRLEKEMQIIDIAGNKLLK